MIDSLSTLKKPAADPTEIPLCPGWIVAQLENNNPTFKSPDNTGSSTETGFEFLPSCPE